MKFTDPLPHEAEIIKNYEYLEKYLPKLLGERVRIDERALGNYAFSLGLRKKVVEHWTIPGMYPLDDMAFARFIFWTGLVNFAYWLDGNPEGRKKFEFENPNGKPFSGAFALDKCFYRAFGERAITSDMIEPHFESMEKARIFFKGLCDIPFLEWRYWNMREALDVLKKHFNKDPINIYEEARWDVKKLVALLVLRFPLAFGGGVTTLNLYNTSPKASGHKILSFPFYKLAKLLPVLYQGRALRPGSSLSKLVNTETIVAICDYEVPKALRHAGVLVYGEELAQKVDTEKVIHRHSLDELAIRAANTVANYEILKRLENWDIVALDFAQWSSGKASAKPHHRTPTPAY